MLPNAYSEQDSMSTFRVAHGPNNTNHIATPTCAHASPPPHARPPPHIHKQKQTALAWTCHWGSAVIAYTLPIKSLTTYEIRGCVKSTGMLWSRTTRGCGLNHRNVLSRSGKSVPPSSGILSYSSCFSRFTDSGYSKLSRMTATKVLSR